MHGMHSQICSCLGTTLGDDINAYTLMTHQISHGHPTGPTQPSGKEQSQHCNQISPDITNLTGGIPQRKVFPGPKVPVKEALAEA